MDEKRGPPDFSPNPDETPTQHSGSVPQPRAAAPSGHIGPFRILGVLGEGGMGVVYEAEQTEPKRRVAVKVVRGGRFVDEGLVRMFQREVDTLARLDHPNIGAIYQSGRTDGGQHYFAMELVQGKSLDAWLAERPKELDWNELELRLRLFGSICDAVHYAHQRGVTHRDLKPSNIVVVDEASAGGASSTSARAPIVKILDFGLARITDADVHAASMATEVGVIKGTLSYMSPEQARGTTDAIDVRADVYALGVIFYELLAAVRPYDVTGASLLEAVRIICEERPRPLSQSYRGPGRLDRDLETIAAKALEKDPELRYASAAALSGDVALYLAQQPILAHPPSTSYQLRKFAQRRRGLVVAASIVLAVLILGLAATTWGLQRARTEAEHAKQIAAFLQDMLRGVGPRVAQGADTELLRDILERTAERIDEELADQPRVAASLHGTIGNTYTSLGEYAAAEAHLRSAAALNRRVYGTSSVEELGAQRDLAGALYWNGDAAESDAMLERILDEIERGRVTDPQLAAAVRHKLGVQHFQQGRVSEGVALLEVALETRRAEYGPRAEEVFETMTALGLARLEQGRAEDAAALLADVLANRRELHGDTNPVTIESVFNLAGAYEHLAEFDAAEELFVEALRGLETMYGAEHPRTIGVRNQLGRFYERQQRLEEAEPHLVAAYRSAVRELGPGHPLALSAASNLASARRSQGRVEEAETVLRDALAATDGSLDAGTAAVQRILIAVLMQQDKHDEAVEVGETLARRSLELWGEKNTTTFLNVRNAAHAMSTAGRFGRAAELYQLVLEGQLEMLGPTNPSTMITMNSLAVLRMRQGDFAAAKPLLTDVIASQTEILGPDHVDTVITVFNLAHAHQNLSELEPAEARFREAVERFERTLDPRHGNARAARSGLAGLLSEAGRYEEAAEPLVRTAELLLADERAPARLKQSAVDEVVELYETWGKPDEVARWEARRP